MTRFSRPLLFGKARTALHLIGVGGMGMAPLAIFLRQSGFLVTGEDDALTTRVKLLLEREGVVILPAGRPSEKADLVIYSSAISPSHPSYVRAAVRGTDLVRRGEMLAEVLRTRKVIAVAGSHGKTTTTAMLIAVLHRAGFPAGYLLGGLFGTDTMSPASVGTSEWVVTEVDESDGTISRFSPEITVAVNLDWDHPDHYRSIEALNQTFADLFTRTSGAVFFSSACAISRNVLVAQQNRRAISFGPGGDYDFSLHSQTGESMELMLAGRFRLTLARVKAAGMFNAMNATAALAVAEHIGISLDEEVLAEYPGVRRRQQKLFSDERFTVLEDYAHHPAEIRALLEATRPLVKGRMLVVFQPHRYSRTLQFKTDFAQVLSTADRLYLLDVYGAGEEPLPGGTTADLCALIQKNTPALPVQHWQRNEEESVVKMAAELQPGDWVLFVGAGDLDRLARDLAQRLAERPVPKIPDFWTSVKRAISAETKLSLNEPLAQKTTLLVGGAARYYAEPASVADLQVLFQEANRAGIPVFLLGRGSNLIVPDDGVNGLVIRLQHDEWQRFEPRSDGCIWAGAGLRLKTLCGLASKRGLQGFEFLEGIPGTVGGALRMNAGAMGGWMFDVVEELHFMLPTGEICVLPKSRVNFTYRSCPELVNAVALGAVLKPVGQTEAGVIAGQMEEFKNRRKESQPREPSAGCIFKNPPGSSAGKLIDEVGLKGSRVGRAEVSAIHANFIINCGGATSEDVIKLVREVRARVKEARAIELEPEVLLYGKEWKEVL